MNPAEILDITRSHESSAANTFRISDQPPVFIRGNGSWLYDCDDNPWLDLVCGSATSNLGHSHPAHLEALREAVSTGILHTGTRLPSAFRARLYSELASVLPAELSCIQLANSGAEAIETAIKAAQFATGRRRLIAFEGGYHGRSLGALSVTDGERIRRPFALLEDLVEFLPYPCQGETGGTGAEESISRLADRLSALRREDDLPAALVIEAVQGVSGVRQPAAGFLTSVRELTRQFQVLLICDEIWNGFGRAGQWFAFERCGIVPDMIAMGKGMSGGLPLSAVAASPAILQAWPPGMHTSTFQGNPLSCSMAAATIRVIREDGLLAHVRNSIESAFERALCPLAAHSRVGGVRIVGAQAAVDIVDGTGAPDPESVAWLQRAALELRILIYQGGRFGNSVMFVPPINADGDQLERGFAAVAGLITSRLSAGR